MIRLVFSQSIVCWPEDHEFFYFVGVSKMEGTVSQKSKVYRCSVEWLLMYGFDRSEIEVGIEGMM